MAGPASVISLEHAEKIVATAILPWQGSGLGCTFKGASISVSMFSPLFWVIHPLLSHLEAVCQNLSQLLSCNLLHSSSHDDVEY